MIEHLRLLFLYSEKLISGAASTINVHVARCCTTPYVVCLQELLIWNPSSFIQFCYDATQRPLYTILCEVSSHGVFSGPYFPAFGLNTERYFVSLHIQSECGKIRTRKNSVFGHFSRSAKEPFHSFLNSKYEAYLDRYKLFWQQLNKYYWHFLSFFCCCCYTVISLFNNRLFYCPFTSIILTPFHKNYLLDADTVFKRG